MTEREQAFDTVVAVMVFACQEVERSYPEVAGQLPRLTDLAEALTVVTGDKPAVAASLRRVRNAVLASLAVNPN